MKLGLIIVKPGSTFTILKYDKNMQREIYKNSPLVAVFNVFEDFASYKTGVYRLVKGRLGGGHAVRVIGWGVEDGTPYWLATNTWNSDWGDKGLFKIVRGVNECGFETQMVAGYPLANVTNKPKRFLSNCTKYCNKAYL